MRIEILGTESLGVRGLCCIVHTHDRHIVIDPGVALGYQRAGLLPHPIQVAAGEDVRNKIIKNLKNATDVVISHFHGDHIPLENANPYQLSLQSVADLLQSPRLWVKGIDGEKPHIADRRNKLLIAFEIPSPCDNQTHGMLSFSKTMPHGLPHLSMGTVMMTRIEDGHDVFVHASDIQLLSDEPLSKILDWQPTVLLVSGPPLYRHLSENDIGEVYRRVESLTEKVPVCIIDHHLLRCRSGVQWLDELKTKTHGRILCAADFMNKKRRFLEANRSLLYDMFPIPTNWHESYKQKTVTTSEFHNLDLTDEEAK